MPKVSRKALGTVYIVQGMDTLNFGIVFPLLPEIASKFDANATMVGSMATTYALASLVCTPLLGRLSDRFGRRPILLVAVAGTAMSGLLTGMASQFPILIAARLLNGACGGTGGVANAYVADVTSAEEKPIYMSYVSGANSLGLILGPALGGILIRWGFSAACFASAGLSAFNFAVCAKFMTESRWISRDESLVSEQVSGTIAEAANGNNAGTPSVPRVACFLFAAFFLFVLAFAAFETVTGYFLMDTYFDGDSVKGGQVYGFIFVIVGIVLFVMSTFFYKPMYKRFGATAMIVTGVLIRSTGFILMALSPTWILFMCATTVQVVGSSLIFPTTSAMLTAMCSKEIYGRALSYNEASGSLARVVGPVIFGKVYDHLTHEFSFYACAVAGLVAGALVMCAIRRSQDVTTTMAPQDEDLRMERQLTPPP